MYKANIFMAIKTQIWQIATTNKTHVFTLQTQKDKTLYIEQIRLWLITKQNDTEDLHNI